MSAGVFVLVWLAFSTRAPIPPSAALLLVASMIIGLVIGDSLYFEALKRIGVARAMPISMGYPVTVVAGRAAARRTFYGHVGDRHARHAGRGLSRRDASRRGCAGPQPSAGQRLLARCCARDGGGAVLVVLSDRHQTALAMTDVVTASVIRSGFRRDPVVDADPASGQRAVVRLVTRPVAPRDRRGWSVRRRVHRPVPGVHSVSRRRYGRRAERDIADLCGARVDCVSGRAWQLASRGWAPRSVVGVVLLTVGGTA